MFWFDCLRESLLGKFPSVGIGPLEWRAWVAHKCADLQGRLVTEGSDLYQSFDGTGQSIQERLNQTADTGSEQ